MTLTLAPPSPRPGVVRIHPAPRLEPPFDDEYPDAGTPGAGSAPPGSAAGTPGWLARDWAGGTPDGEPADWRPTGDSRTGGGARAGEELGEHRDRKEPPRLTAGEVAAARFVKACLEVLDGFRPVRHLIVLVAPEHYEAVQATLLRPRRRRGPNPSLAPHRPAQPAARQRGQLDPVGVRLQVVMEPADGVAEVSVVLGRGPERWAMAVRLERRPVGWLCTFLEVL